MIVDFYSNTFIKQSSILSALMFTAPYMMAFGYISILFSDVSRNTKKYILPKLELVKMKN